jgi:hypothetical protein
VRNGTKFCGTPNGNSLQLMDVTQLIEITQQNSVDISDFGRVCDNLFICLVFP